MTTIDRAGGPLADGEGLVEIDGIDHYAVVGFDTLDHFLMSVVSDGDRWMFPSSSGALTAGRRSADGSIFPYETDDRLHRAGGQVGPVTAIDLPGGRRWRPFDRCETAAVRRNLYKAVAGDRLVLEELHPDGLVFRFRWASCEEHGFVRTSTVVNDEDTPVTLRVVDGLLHLLPAGIEPAFYREMSNLAAAYMRSEVIDPATGLAVYSLESRIVDRAEPAEALRATVAWSIAPDGATVTLDPKALDGDRREPIHLRTGRPGAYLLDLPLTLQPGGSATWHIAVDTPLDQPRVAALRRRLRENDAPVDVLRAIDDAHRNLVVLMAGADGLQRTGAPVASAHHLVNVTYNVMRGGIPVDGYRVDVQDLLTLLERRNRAVAERHRDRLEALGSVTDRRTVLHAARESGDPELIRLALEHLPFTFSRRHGDPSRPWNRFSIRVRDEHGRPVTGFEGNWRDIFQNWEALALSYPLYLDGMIARFVDASTADGYNPYRITHEGIDWEVPDPDDPWSNIGYWGDHQIVYLHRLLHAAQAHRPGSLTELLDRRWFTYAAVPYRIRPYADIVADPKHTIVYDEKAAEEVADRVARLGTDGRLMADRDGTPRRVTFLEKLVVPALAKLSNLVAGGGIWMNTQRPEWNDANNALVGSGLSMVTLCQLRPYLADLHALVRRAGLEAVDMSAEVADWLEAVTSHLTAAPPAQTATDPVARRALLDAVGQAYSAYREQVYDAGFSGERPVRSEDIVALCDAALGHLDAAIAANRRPDGLFHAYNLLRFDDDGRALHVERLPEMLEGQVAVLDSEALEPRARLAVLDALFDSALYREDQRSFMLYPPRRLPPFLERNVIDETLLARNPLLQALAEHPEAGIVVRDVDGRLRFAADLSERADLEDALDRLARDERWAELVARHRARTVEAYRTVFGHHAYTGRSGSMYAYEGIGSIYWHMVAKLLVSAQAAVFDAKRAGADEDLVEALIDRYRRIRAGLGFNKTAREHGAIPIDPYSHTPAHAGAQQPGMTGLVKEEILTRRAEVGVTVEDGRIRFVPTLIDEREALADGTTWTIVDPFAGRTVVSLDAGSFGSTVCQVPIVVRRGADVPTVTAHLRDGEAVRIPGDALDRETSGAIFARTGEVAQVVVELP